MTAALTPASLLLRLPLRLSLQAAIQAILEAWTPGVPRPLVGLPAGAGKTGG